MHPAIAEFPSRLFYKGRIQTGLSAEERPLPPGAPQQMHLLRCCLQCWWPFFEGLATSACLAGSLPAEHVCPAPEYVLTRMSWR